MVATRAYPNSSVYSSTKGAVDTITHVLSAELGAKKIRVNSISAGPVKTLAAAGIRDFRSMLAAAEEKTPLRENITADDVGAMGAFLCGPGGKHITGAAVW